MKANGWVMCTPTSPEGDPGGSGIVVGATANPSASFTRPGDTTAYTAGDLVANSTTANQVVPMSFTLTRAAASGGSIVKARLSKSGTSITNAAFRLHLFSASPTVANGDNGALSAAGSANYIGAIDFPTPVTNGAGSNAFSDGANFNGAPLTGNSHTVALAAGQTIYGLLEARGAYTPANGETFAVTLEVLQD